MQLLCSVRNARAWDRLTIALAAHSSADWACSIQLAATARHTFSTGSMLAHVLARAGAHATTNRFVVDLSFKEQFRIAKPTQRYGLLLDCVPDTYVAPEASVAPLVNFMCHEMALAFSSTGVVLPPWRQTTSMLSKWLPRKSLDEQVPRPLMGGLVPGVTAGAPSGALHAIPMGAPRRSIDMGGQVVHGHWVHTQQQQQESKRMQAHEPQQQQAAAQQQQEQQQAVKAPPPPHQATDLGAAIAALSRRPSASLVKPVVCEPQRVVVGGNFNTISFA